MVTDGAGFLTPKSKVGRVNSKVGRPNRRLKADPAVAVVGAGAPPGAAAVPVVALAPALLWLGLRMGLLPPSVRGEVTWSTPAEARLVLLGVEGAGGAEGETPDASGGPG